MTRAWRCQRVYTGGGEVAGIGDGQGNPSRRFARCGNQVTGSGARGRRAGIGCVSDVGRVGFGPVTRAPVLAEAVQRDGGGGTGGVLSPRLESLVDMSRLCPRCRVSAHLSRFAAHVRPTAAAGSGSLSGGGAAAGERAERDPGPHAAGGPQWGACRPPPPYPLCTAAQWQTAAAATIAGMGTGGGSPVSTESGTVSRPTRRARPTPSNWRPAAVCPRPACSSARSAD